MIITNNTLKEYFYDIINRRADEVNLKSKTVIDYYSDLLLNCEKSKLFYLFYNSSISQAYLFAIDSNDIDEIKIIGDSCVFLSSYYIIKGGELYPLYQDLGYKCYSYLYSSRIKNNKIYGEIIKNYNKALSMLLLIGVDNNKENEIEYMLKVYNINKNPYIKKRLAQNNLLIFCK